MLFRSEEFREVRKESRMHQRDRFTRQFEQLHSRRGKMDDVAQRAVHPRILVSSVAAPAQDLASQDRNEDKADLAGNAAGETGVEAHTGNDASLKAYARIPSQSSSPVLTKIMAHEGDDTVQEGNHTSSANSTAGGGGDGIGQASTGADSVDRNYRPAFIFILLLIVYEYIRRRIYP